MTKCGDTEESLGDATLCVFERVFPLTLTRSLPPSRRAKAPLRRDGGRERGQRAARCQFLSGCGLGRIRNNICISRTLHKPPQPLLRRGYVFSVIAARANGARTLVRRKVGWRQCLETSQRGSAVPTFLRDKSRAPGQFLVGALNRYKERRCPSITLASFPSPPSQRASVSASLRRDRAEARGEGGIAPLRRDGGWEGSGAGRLVRLGREF